MEYSIHISSENDFFQIEVQGLKKDWDGEFTNAVLCSLKINLDSIEQAGTLLGYLGHYAYKVIALLRKNELSTLSK
jgi:hypothetical protein